MSLNCSTNCEQSSHIAILYNIRSVSPFFISKVLTFIYNFVNCYKIYRLYYKYNITDETIFFLHYILEYTKCKFAINTIFFAF